MDQLCPEGAGEKPLPGVTRCTLHTPLCYPYLSLPHLTWLGSSTWEGLDSQPVPVPKPWRDTWGDRAGGVRESEGKGHRAGGTGRVRLTRLLGLRAPSNA